jgi:hypothetical protein
MEFNEHQIRLWKRMIDAVEKYYRKDLSLFNLVGWLESSLDAGEFKDEELLKEWDDLCLQIEIWNALKEDGQEIPMDKVEQDVSHMEAFLKRTIEPYLHKNDY